MIRIPNINVPVDDFNDIPRYAAAAAGVTEGRILSWRWVRKSVDARHRRPQLVVTVDVELADEDEFAALLAAGNAPAGLEVVREVPYVAPSPGTESLSGRPVIVGAGPAGLFCALTLARAGYAPIVLERGDSVADRTAAISRFWNGGSLDPESNVQFGEGGAGTFSDGKLTTRIHDPRCGLVLRTFVQAGAPAEIEWEHMPHIGTDRLRTVIPKITEAIRAAGGEVRFRTRVERLALAADGTVTGVVCADGTVIGSGAVVLATGHSARDTIANLAAQHVEMTAKAFAIGLRIEHPQKTIDAAQYGPFAGHPALPPAVYRLAQQVDPKRSAWTFCMCPGGSIINSASELGGVVTNGMSNLARDGRFANSALVANVTESDFPVPGPLGGIELQRRIERAAFATATRPGAKVRDGIPMTTVADFRHEAGYLPRFILDTLDRALPVFGRKIRGFDAPGTPMLGPETRTSSPVRVTRGDDCRAVRNPGLYPCGEGAGYAGGIVSAAVDGIRVAESIIARFSPAADR